MTRNKKKAAIVGAGPGGLATAMLLAQRGVKVDVFERADVVGGRTSIHSGAGFKFDLGPTFFMYPRVLREIFDTCGFDLDKELDMVRLDPQYRIIFGAGGQIDATSNLEKMKEEVARISPTDADALEHFFNDNREKLKAFEPILQRPFHGWKDLMDPGLLKLLPLLRPQLSLDGDLGRFFKDERIRLAFSFQSKYLGMSPFRCPSLFSILSFLEYEYGVYHPIGGCGQVTKVMAKLAEKMGVNIHLNDEVKGFDFDGKRVTKIRSASGMHATDATVLNADFARSMTRLVPDSLRNRWSDKQIDKKQFSCSTFMLYLGIKGKYDDLKHHTIYISKDYSDNLDQIENKMTLSDDPSFYVQNACVTDPSLAPEGMSTLYILLPVPHQTEKINWDEEQARYREIALDQLKKIGLDDVRERIEYEYMVTPKNWDEDYQIHLGATFNLAHTFKQMLHLRPRNRFEDLDGVYLTGGGTHPGSGLPVIFESARMSSKLALDDLGLSEHSAGSRIKNLLKSGPVRASARTA